MRQRAILTCIFPDSAASRWRQEIFEILPFGERSSPEIDRNCTLDGGHVLNSLTDYKVSANSRRLESGVTRPNLVPDGWRDFI